jgi:DNA-binding PadR family transcriptional regulator
MADHLRPERFLPLAPVWFEILLALATDDLHGYAVMQEVARRSSGAVTLHPGSLYRALARLVEDGLIVELDARPASGDDERRRYYQITSLGRAVARAETERLRALVRAAEDRALVEPLAAAKRGRP